MRHIICVIFIMCYSWLSDAQQNRMQLDTIRAADLLKQVERQSDLGDHLRALNMVKSASEIYSSYGLWKQTILCEVRLAKIADNFDSPELKIYHSDQALSLANKYLKKDDIVLASAFRQKAEALMWVEQLDSANYYLKHASPIFRNKRVWKDYGWTNVLLAVNHLNSYQLDSCIYHLSEVENLLQNYKFSVKVFKEFKTTIFDLKGIAYEIQGDYNRAITNLKEALETNLMSKNISEWDSIFISNQYNSLGAIYLTKGDYHRAEDNFLQALTYDQNASKDPNFLNNVGHQYLKRGKFILAKEYFERSAKISNPKMGSSHEKNSNARIYEESINSICTCYRFLGEYELALNYCQKAESLAKGLRKYITWATMGHIFLDKKQPKKAVYYLNKAKTDLVNRAERFQDKILIHAKILFLLGEAHSQLQNQKKALAFLQKSLIANHRKFDDSLTIENNPSLDGIYEPIYFLETIRAKASIQASFPDDPKSMNSALNSFQLAVQWIDNLKTSYVLDSTQIDWSSEYKSIYEEALDVAYALYENTNNSEYLEIAFGISEKSRGSILLEQLKSKKGKFQAGIPDSLLQKSKDLRLDIVFYNQELLKAKEKKEEAKTKLYKSYLSKYRLELIALEEKMERAYPNFYRVKYAQEQITIKQIQQELLGEESAILEYFMGTFSAYVFVVTKAESTMIKIEGVEELRSKVDVFVQQLQDVDGFRVDARAAINKFNKNSTELYKQLLELPLKEIAVSTSHLIIVPDGILSTLSYETLTNDILISSTSDFAKLPFLIYKYQFQYSFSAQMLIENMESISTSIPNSDCLGFAPDYHLNESNALSGSFNTLRNTTENLVGTGEEIFQISNFVNGNYYIGEMASERKFKEKSDEYGILHLAMHGIVDIEDPNYNHLKFSNRSADNTEDNLLHQYEIVNMNLNAQMIVLSACETGVGKLAEGEGVFSLGRSFMYAGVPSIVMSMWRVSDASTSQIMPRFYENLSKKESKVSALHHAKIDYLNSADLTMRHPFYWSAFVVIGDGQALKAINGISSYWILGGLLLLILGGVIWQRKRANKNSF